MPMNRIQPQLGLPLAALLHDDGDGEAALIKARWPNGFVCDRCQCTPATVPPTTDVGSGNAKTVAIKPLASSAPSWNTPNCR
jgi:hypothetical protein